MKTLLGDALEENRKLRADARIMRKAAIAFLRKVGIMIPTGSLRQHRDLLEAIKQSQRTKESCLTPPTPVRHGGFHVHTQMYSTTIWVGSIKKG